MRRRLIIGERIMYVDAETPLNCVFAVKIRGTILLENLRVALTKIQQKHPLLRTRIKEDSAGVPHFVSSNSLSAIPLRIVERLGDEDWQQQSKAEWKTLFDSESLPMARIVWIKGTECSELLLVCPHCICDGTGFVALMSEMLQLLDHPEQELVPYPPFNSIEELLSSSFKSSTAKVLKTKAFAVLARLFFFFKSSKTIHPKGEGYLLHWKLTAAETSALAGACKDAGVTMHAALCVAFLEAFQLVRGTKAQGKVICPVDVRHFVEEIKKDALFAFAPIAELSLPKEKVMDFWAKATELKTELKKKTAAMKVHELLVMSEYFQGSVNKMLKHLKTTDGGHDLTLSNMGRLGIAEHYDSFEVETLYSPNVGFPWRNANTLVVSTFKERMDFAFLSNASFLPEEEAKTIRDQAMELLRTHVMVSYA